MSQERIKIALPPHRRIDIKRQLNERMKQGDMSPADLDCRMAEDSLHQPTIDEIVTVAVRLNYQVHISDIQFIPMEQHDE